MLPMNRLGWGWAAPGTPEKKRGWKCKFTKEETRTMITLWCIFRAPLMIGTDLPQIDDATLSLLTNDEVLSLEKNSHGAFLVTKDENQCVCAVLYALPMDSRLERILHEHLPL